MAKKKKLRKKHLASKRFAHGAVTSGKALAKKRSTKRKTSANKSKKKKAAQRRSVARERSSVARATSGKIARAGSGRQAGDLQGLSTIAGADSESVGELLEEGNAFEADAVMGVEASEDEDPKEVRTHEVLEDDVPGEYLDKE
jgi:hypothetical protein